MRIKKQTTLLCILDGVGIGPQNETNALYTAHTPTLDHLNANHPHSQLRSDGSYVGVPEGQMGNSEVGHITIGTGRVIKQSLIQIIDDFKNKQFQSKNANVQFLSESINSRAIHLIGLLSSGGIHSHIDHAFELCQSLNELGKPIFVHAITDGRDTSVNAGIEEVSSFEDKIKDLKNVYLVTIIGRFYAMDRDNRWERTELAWNLYTKAQGAKFSDATEALSKGYNDGLSDEHIKPSLIETDGKLDSTIQDKDSVFLFNFRGDRMRQLSRCFLGLGGVKFDCSKPDLNSIVAMTLYDSEFADHCRVIYPPKTCKNSLGEVVSIAGLKQLRIAETEKYAHVTFFFNNGRELPFEKENRTLVPSPREVATYDLKPEMSLPELTTRLVDAINSNEYHLIVLNIANADMVGHTGNYKASLIAVEHIDKALSKITKAIDGVVGEMLIIADHGNIEQMSVDDKPSTTHTLNPVPCIYYGSRKITLKNGALSDVAPTVLEMLGIDAPKEMTGSSLLNNAKKKHFKA